MSTHRLSGILYFLAAATFLLGWALMPDAGTKDAAHILEAVAAQRSAVWWSVVAHMLSGVAFLGAVLGTQSDPRANATGLARLGAWLVAVGGMGVTMDGFFHLVAFYMTADGVAPQGVLEPMRLLQSKGLAFLVPLLLAFIAGGLIYAAGLNRAAVTTAWPTRLFVLAIAFAIGGGGISAGLGQGRRAVVLGFLSLLTLAYGRIGYEVATGRTPTTET